MKYFKLVIFLFVIIPFSLEVKASHVPGGNISYENIGPNNFVITLTVFEDCSGAISVPNAPQIVMASNDCGLISPNISLPNIVYQDEVSQLCLQMIGQSECNGGGLPGVYMHVWRDTITLSGGCDSWVFAWDGCCRNTSINASSSNSYYWETVLNSITAPANSSPIITSKPIPYNCNNQPVNYNFGVYEPDGDSLHYSLVSAMTGPGGFVLYNAGYSGASPINGININPNTGEITFTPTILGNFVVAVLIEEYNSNGNLVGSIVQDFQFRIISCTNSNPSPSSGGIINFTGNATLTGPFDIQACEGDSICFDMEFTDVNLTDSIYVNSNISQLFPGATVTQNSFFSPVTATFCMYIPPDANSFNTISVTVNDNACPIMGTTSSAIGLTVISSTYAGLDFTMCQGTGTPLNASGGSNFNWSIISGDPISIGNNFSCNGCPSPIANPAFSTIYKVVSNLSGGCTNIDTVAVTVVPDFNYSLTQSSSTTCLNSTTQLNAVPSTVGNYTYQWSPSSFLTSPNIGNPEFNTSILGLYEYELTMTSDLGCVKIDTLTLEVIPKPNVTLTMSDTSISCGDTVFISAGLSGSGGLCGPSSANSCNSASSFQTVGMPMGSNSNTSYPAPFGHYYKSNKEQYLFKASEIIAAGIQSRITAIAWETTAQNSATDSFFSYTIKMGCTVENQISDWQTGLSTVFSPQNINVALGQNNFQLTTAYEWDGISNLIVEVCFNNLSNGQYTSNWTTPYQITPFNSAISYSSDVIAACSFNGSPTVVENKRPVTKFKTCSFSVDTSNITFQWFSSSFLSSNSDQFIYSIPTTSTNYTVITNDLNSGCSDTSSIFINLNNFNTDFTVNQSLFTAPPFAAQFTNTTPNIADFNFTWDFSDGTILQSNNPSVFHQFLNNGLYDVTLIAENILTGCADTMYKDDFIFCTGGTSCTHASTINQTGPITACLSDSIFLSCNTDPTFSYQWRLNGTYIPGAVDTIYYPVQSGNYSVLISQNGCPEVSSDISVTVAPTPNPPFITSSGSFVPCQASSVTLSVPNNFATYSWSSGGTASSEVITSSGSYSVTVTNSGGCASTSLPLNVNASFIQPPDVCIVGVNPQTNFNRVVWEKPVSTVIDSFYVYKETNQANVYQKVGGTSFADSAIFDDVSSNPAIQAYRYKLSVVDSCGIESNLGALHKTIHLTINQGIGTSWNLIWSSYEGFAFPSYNIYRGTNSSNMVLLTTIASNLNSYTDLNAPAGQLYYQIEVVSSYSCDPSKSFNTSRSNMVENGEAPSLVINQENNLVKVFPNPTNENITISVNNFTGNIQTEVYDLIGNRLQMTNETTISLQDYSRGIYLLKVAYGDRVEEVKVIKD